MSMKVNKVLPSPAELKEEYPLSEKLIQLKKERDAEIRDIFTGKSDKFAVIIGPCSADNEDSVCEYVSRLAKVNAKSQRSSDADTENLYQQAENNRGRI